MSQILHTEQPVEPERKKLGAIVGGGTTVEAVTGLATATLAVIGLAGVMPFYMRTIGIITAGAALFIDGVAIGGAYAKLAHDHALQTGAEEDIEVSTGLSAQVLGGAAALILGILGLLGLFSATLTGVAVIALGGAMLLGGAARAELNWSALELRRARGSSRVVTQQAVRGASGIVSLVGLAVLVLGIIALVQIGESPATTPWPTLVLVALLGVGAAELLGGSTGAARVGAGVKH